MIESFIQQAKQERWLELMRSDKGRKKLRSSLAHSADIDPAVKVSLPSSQQHATSIFQLLIESGAPRVCSLISENPDWDGVEMHLDVALKQIVGYGFGTIVNCVPGKLAFFEGEGPKDRYVLKRSL